MPTDDPTPGDRVVVTRADGRYDVGEVVTITEGAGDAPHDYGEIVVLSYGVRSVVVQFDPNEHPFDTFEHAQETARGSAWPTRRVWVRRHMALESLGR